MKLKIISIVIFLISTHIKVDYTPYSIIELVEKAEVIGRCKIITVSKDTFTVEFEDIIKGKPNKQLEIVKFKNWTCASRWIDYKVGQTELIFLEKNEKGWQALGSGNEGEVFIQDNSIFYRHYIPVRKKNEMFELQGKKYFGLTFNYAEVKDAITYYLTNSSNLKKMKEEEIKNFKSDNLFLQGIINCATHSFN